MISEVTFATGFTSAWRGLTPTSEIFIRRINGGLYDRVFPELKSGTAPTRRALIREVGFIAFTLYGEELLSGFQPSAHEISQSTGTAQRAIGSLNRTEESSATELNEIERIDAVAQASRLATFFIEKDKKPILIGPEFPGCGIVDSCNGDVLMGDVLYEVKAGNRKFRSIDVRQLLVYLALNYPAQSHDILAVGLFNPRIGISFEVSLDEFCFEVSGQSTPDLLAEVVRALSSGEMSR